MNDLTLTDKLLFPDDGSDHDRLPGERIALLRLTVAQVWETHLLVAEAIKDPACTAFLQQVADAYPDDREYSGPDLLAALAGSGGATAPTLRNALRVARNATLHYPKPGDAQLRAVLQEMTDSEGEGEISHGALMPTFRATFADDVILRLAFADDEDLLHVLFAALSDSVIAVIHLAQIAIDLWLTRPAGDPLPSGG
jgi:hypothetical protein